MQNENDGCSAGSNGEIFTVPQRSSDDSLRPALTRLAAAMEEQNKALWALVEQTAALIEIVIESDGEDDEDDEPRTYLDGTRM